MQIAALERKVQEEKESNANMLEELSLQTRMMDSLLGFRDKECAREARATPANPPVPRWPR